VARCVALSHHRYICAASSQHSCLSRSHQVSVVFHPWLDLFLRHLPIMRPFSCRRWSLPAAGTERGSSLCAVHPMLCAFCVDSFLFATPCGQVWHILGPFFSLLAGRASPLADPPISRLLPAAGRTWKDLANTVSMNAIKFSILHALSARPSVGPGVNTLSGERGVFRL